VSLGGQAGLDIETPRGMTGGYQGEATEVNQRGMVNQVVIELGHIYKRLIQFDKAGSDEGSEGDRREGPSDIQVAFREVGPIQSAEET
jgi:hypothetical protein